MRWSVADSRIAVGWRRWRSRRGLSSAPRAVVRAHVPWYRRALGVAAILSITLAGAGWIYDAGRRIAGFERGESEQERQTLRARNAVLERELSQLRSIASSSESTLQIERAAQQQLAKQIGSLEEENGRLKEELAFFESLASGHDAGPGPTIHRVRVMKDTVPGQYRYRLLVGMQGGKRKNQREFRGEFQLVVQVQGQGKNATIVLPASDDPDRHKFLLNFNHFQRIDGTFQVPEGGEVTSVEVRLLQDGAMRAVETVAL